MFNRTLQATAAAALLAVAGVASANVVTLDFEGLQNREAVLNFYNGGTGSLGSSGTNYGVAFSGPTLAVIDSDAGGSGNFANEPSPSTIMFFLDANSAILNFEAGFDTGFSFFYSSAVAATVSVFDGLNGAGNLLGSINIVNQANQGCQGDPNGFYCNWTAVGVAFGGTARSINFGGTANFTGYDNITFGSVTPGGVLPEPASLVLASLALLSVAASRRRKD
jgi:hypothetical protein